MSQKQLQRPGRHNTPIDYNNAQLGQFQQTYSQRRAYRTCLFTFGVVLMLTCFVLLYRIDFSVAHRFLSMEGVIIIALMLIASIVIIYYGLDFYAPVIHIYTKGMVFQKQKKSIILNWQDIDSIWQRPIKKRYQKHQDYIYYCYLLRTKHNQYLEIGDRKAGILLNRLITQAQLPALLEKIEAGGEVGFGTWNATAQGIYNEKSAIKWAHIKRIMISDRWVSLISEDGLTWAMASVNRVPNLFLLVTLYQVMQQTPDPHPQADKYDFKVSRYIQPAGSLKNLVHEFAHIYQIGDFRSLFQVISNRLNYIPLTRLWHLLPLDLSFFLVNIMWTITEGIRLIILWWCWCFIIYLAIRGTWRLQKVAQTFHIYDLGFVLQFMYR